MRHKQGKVHCRPTHPLGTRLRADKIAGLIAGAGMAGKVIVQ